MDRADLAAVPAPNALSRAFSDVGCAWHVVARYPDAGMNPGHRPVDAITSTSVCRIREPVYPRLPSSNCCNRSPDFHTVRLKSRAAIDTRTSTEI